MEQAIIEKLRKILRLAGDKAATPGEIEAAMAKARAIAMEHSIELSQIDTSSGQGKKAAQEVVKDEMTFGKKTKPRYYVYIFRALKECLGVHAIIKGGLRRGCPGFWLVGDPHDVAVAREIFPWLENAFSKAFNTSNLPNDASHKHGFYSGMAAGIIAANKRAEKETLASKKVTEQQWGLVVRSKEEAITLRLPVLFPMLSQARKSTIRGRDGTAQNMGFEKGRTVRLGQVGAGGSAGQLN